MKKNMLKIMSLIALTFAFTIILSGAVAAATADVSVNKYVNQTTVNVGEPYYYVIAVNNAGPDPATGVQVTDLLPTTLNFQTATPTQGTYNQVSGLWDIGTILSGDTAYLNIYATPNASGAGTTITNTATKTAENEIDPTTPDTASVNIYVPLADVAIAKTSSNYNPNVGQNFNITLTAHNYGPDTANGVVLTDPLPAGLNWVSFVSTSSGIGVWNAGDNTVRWYIGPMVNGDTETLIFTVTPDVSAYGTTLTNTATKTAQNEYDPSPDSSSININVAIADVQVNKYTSNPAPRVGQEFYYVVAVSNNGPGTATGVQVTDIIQPGLTLNSATPSQGTYVGGIWNIGSIASGTTVYLNLYVTPQASAVNTNIANTATKTAEDQFDPTTPDSSTVNIHVLPQEADISVVKTTSKTNPNVGTPFFYTVTVTNNGPDNATGLSIYDFISGVLTINSITPSQGSYSLATRLWTIGTLASGATATMIINVTPKASAAGHIVVNNAHVNTLDQADYTPADDTSTVNVYPNNSVTISQLESAALSVKNYYESHSSTLPATVNLNGQPVTMAQLLQLLVTGTLNINNGNLNPILVQNVNNPTSPSGSNIPGDLQKPEYLSVASSIQSYININGIAPNNRSTSLGNIIFSKLVYTYAKVINFYAGNARLPNFVSVA